jgi:flagellar biosynthesis GTPase FlhF
MIARAPPEASCDVTPEKAKPASQVSSWTRRIWGSPKKQQQKKFQGDHPVEAKSRSGNIAGVEWQTYDDCKLCALVKRPEAIKALHHGALCHWCFSRTCFYGRKCKGGRSWHDFTADQRELMKRESVELRSKAFAEAEDNKKKKEAEDNTKKEAEDNKKKGAEDNKKKEAEDTKKKEAENTKKEAEDRKKKEAEDTKKKDAEDNAKKKAKDNKKKKAEDNTKKASASKKRKV